MNGGRTFRAKDHEMLFPNQYKYTTIFGKEHEIRKNQVKLPPNTPKVIERSYLTKNRYLSKPYDTGKVSKVTGDRSFFIILLESHAAGLSNGSMPLVPT
jgi:hypothetical protein